MSILFNLKKKLIRKLEVKIISVEEKKKMWSKTKEKNKLKGWLYLQDFLCV